MSALGYEHDHASIVVAGIAGYKVSHVEEELVKFAAAIAAADAKALALVCQKVHYEALCRKTYWNADLECMSSAS
jgi:hypothetical protein